MSNKSFNELNFSDTEIAFRSKSNAALNNSYFLFKVIGYNWLVKIMMPLTNMAFALRLPIKSLVKNTVYKQFVGGESIKDCEATMKSLFEYKIGTILDYSVEGKENETDFENTCNETIETVLKAKNNPQIPFCVFKVTGLARFALLEKVNSKKSLNEAETFEYTNIKNRIDKICKTAFENNVRIFIDAEESWIQDAIDDLATDMMQKYNKSKAIVYNTLQLYRHDRLAFLETSYQHATQNHYHLGVKLVRGAYMEKERLRAKEFNYTDPIQPSKQKSDEDYNKALAFCLKHIHQIAICAGTHNENSSMLLAELMKNNGLDNGDSRVYFSQLYGMSDNLSYNLANAGYNVAKYLPYGPVKDVMPYLFRRAAENTSVKGQSGRELNLIQTERKRRALAKKL